MFQRQGTLVSGMKERLSDSSTVYVEERYQDIDSATGLTHATGVTLTPDERWNFGVNARGRHARRQSDRRPDEAEGGRLPRRLQPRQDPGLERSRISGR